MSQVVLDCTKDNSRCPRCPELSLGLLWHMMAIPDNPLKHYYPEDFICAVVIRSLRRSVAGSNSDSEQIIRTISCD